MKIIIYCLLLAASYPAISQIKEASYTLTPLKAKFIDSTNPKEIIIIFKHEAKSKQREKLIISGKLTYSLGNNSREKTDILGQGANKHSVTVHDKNMPERDAYIYSLVKDHPDFSLAENVNYLVFTLRNLSDKYVDKMTFIYGLWEPVDENIRIETKYQVQIDR